MHIFRLFIKLGEKMEENKVRTTVNDLITQAEQKYVEFLKSGKYKDLLFSMSNLNCYSLSNHLLILSQMPTETCVNGMKIWNYNHRNEILCLCASFILVYVSQC